jgi:hypothetical protein
MWIKWIDKWLQKTSFDVKRICNKTFCIMIDGRQLIFAPPPNKCVHKLDQKEGGNNPPDIVPGLNTKNC